ncbi:MAG: hypothetical protein JW991_01390 [Candidatus Pacebacteria bacterium]|nr:hypothetical protein [Candidatus Paceibacterota bacterium]
MKIPNLDQIVYQSLRFFKKRPPPRLDLSGYKLPFVIGSGNAYNTGRVIFGNQAAVFADESNFKTKLEAFRPMIKKGLISRALIISSSGEKDSIWEVKLAKKQGLETTLMTCSQNCTAGKFADKMLVYPKIPEPYTYNTSTYLGMILSSTGEAVDLIWNFIRKTELPANFSSYRAYAFILPDECLNICPMIEIKKSELFGGRLAIRAFTQGHARHAKFLVRWERELVISFGFKNQYFGLPRHRWELELPERGGFGLMLALTYFLIGRIQAAKPAYFKEHLEKFCRDYGPAAYGKDQSFSIIVPGS